MKIVVTGGRNFGEKDGELAFIQAELARVHLEHGITSLAHGDQRGLDRHSGEWAKRQGILVKVYPANWLLHGKAAGPIRNRWMLKSEMPDLVLAFPGNAGTLDCIRAATALRLKVTVLRMPLR